MRWCVLLSLLAACGDDTPPVTPVALAISEPAVQVPAGIATQLAALASYSDGSTSDVTAQVAWTIDAPDVALVTGGLVRGLSPGMARATAALGGLSASAAITVTDAQLAELQILPPAPVAAGLRVQLVALGTFSDATQRDLSAAVTWSTDDPARATVSSTGELHALAAGEATVRAASGALAAEATATITTAELMSIELSPGDTSVPVGLDRTYVALGHLSDGTLQDVTTQAIWTTSDASIATVGATGVVHAAKTGTATIAATIGAVTRAATLTVSPAQVTALDVTPAAATLPLGLSRAFTATAHLTDGSLEDVTAQSVWTSDDDTVATVSNGATTHGRVTTRARGVTAITAHLGTLASSATMTVTAAELASVEIAPASVSIPNGLTTQLAATGTFTDATTHDITADVVWTSSDPAVADVVAGTVSTHAVGGAQITASLAGTSGSASVTVTAATLVALAIAPADLTLPSGLRPRFAATGTFSDGTTRDVTDNATWTSSDEAIATISNIERGRAATIAPGTATIRAQLTGVVATASLVVSPESIVDLAITPADATILDGATLQLTATATATDGQHYDVTAQVAWSFDLSVDMTQPGLVRATDVGQGQVRADLLGVVALTTLTVTPAPGVEIVFAGDAAGVVDVAVTDNGNTSYTICDTTCRVDAAIGSRVEIAAFSTARFGGFTGACTGSSADCLLQASATGDTVTASFLTESNERWTRTFAGESFTAADYDGTGNLLIAGSTFLRKLAGDGSPLWQVALPASHVRAGPGDSVTAISGTDLVRLDAGGAVQWRQPLGAAATGTIYQAFDHRLAVGPNGEVAVHGLNVVASWDSNGALRWTQTLNDFGPMDGVAIDDQGTVWVAVESPESPEQEFLITFASDGTRLPVEFEPVSQYHGMFVVDAAQHLVMSSSGHSTLFLSRSTPTGTNEFFIKRDVFLDPDFVENGVAAAGTGDLAWAYAFDDSFGGLIVGFFLNRVTSAGTVLWSIEHPPVLFELSRYGVAAHDVAASRDGTFALVGTLHTLERTTGWVQTYRP
jgi:Big-like domain-containing protein